MGRGLASLRAWGVAALVLASVGTASAQSAVVVLVLGPSSDEAAAVEARDWIAAELAPHIANASAPELGRPPRALGPDLPSRLQAAADPALEHVAFGRTAAALAIIDPLLTEAEADLDALGTNGSASRHAADLALFAARAHLRDREHAAARAALERALRMVPDLRPDANVHPPYMVTASARGRA